MEQANSGYCEIEHTADWELMLWAPDLCSLLVEAAKGMYALAGAEIAESPRKQRLLDLQFLDSEGLLVEFLSELLYLGESENLGFTGFTLRIVDDRLEAHLSGAPFARLTKEIKAVTYHNLSIKRTQRGLETNVVFDV